jgi:hypothetical protein
MIRRLGRGELFYVSAGVHTAFLEVIRNHYRGPYVRTSPDGKLDDNLLSLPPCPPGLKLVA